MKQVIICIVGASGSGKTTASLMLQKQFGWEAVVSYTTRPMRKGETNGVDHWFVTPDKKPSEKEICAYTKFGDYEYWTTWNQFRSLFPCIYVIDEKGLINLQSKETSPFPFHLVTIKINRDNREDIDKERKDRDLERVQLPDEFFDYTIDNDGSIERFKTYLFIVAKSITSTMM